MNKIPVIVICGPTASGKTALSLMLAEHYKTEIVSADSMQVYKKMDIGTAKPTKEEMKGIVHHMIDIVPPQENFSVGKYVDMAKISLQNIYEKGKIPILVGGTGLYIDSLLSATKFGGVEADYKLRQELNLQANELGGAKMKEILAEFDPMCAARLHDNDLKRIVRGIEIYKLTGKPITYWEEQSRQEESPYNPVYFALHTEDREDLYKRIEQRVDQMMEKGLYEEVVSLLEEGVPPSCTSMQGIGYKELIKVINGDCSLPEGVAEIKLNTRHYAKRQYTWFKRNKKISWFSTKYINFEQIYKKCVNMVDFSK